MLASNLITECPTVTTSTPVVEAVQLVTAGDLAGLVVLDADGTVVRVLTGTQVLGLAVPAYCLEDPILARLVDERSSDHFVDALGAWTVGDALPSIPDADLPIVSSRATALEIASLMARAGSTLVAVVDDGRLRGAVSMRSLLDGVLPR